jgi:DNA-binding IclR family transcriptional regulator
VPCIKDDGTLSALGIAMIRAVRRWAGLEEIAHTTGLAPFRARSALRGLQKEGLIEQNGDRYAATPKGLEKLEP